MTPTRAALAALLALVLAACSGAPAVTLTPATTDMPHGAPTGGATLGPRPSSLATIQILAPKQGATIVGTEVRVVLKLTGATIVTETTTTVRPDEGHIHLFVDNQTVSMNYGLEQSIAVTPGTHVLRAELVAADHAPFSPRVMSSDIVFTVN